MSPSPIVSDLPQEWRTRATLLDNYGASGQAETLRKCADELERVAVEGMTASLTLREASDLGGYSPDHLGRLVRDGKIPNAGRPGAPRIARLDVPIKPDWVAPSASAHDIDRTQIVRSAINAGAG